MWGERLIQSLLNSSSYAKPREFSDDSRNKDFRSYNFHRSFPSVWDSASSEAAVFRRPEKQPLRKAFALVLLGVTVVIVWQVLGHHSAGEGSRLVSPFIAAGR